MAMFDLLPEDLVEEILSRVPRKCFGAVRSTCKRWNGLSKDRILRKGDARQEYIAIMVKESKVFSVSLDLHGMQKPKYAEFVAAKSIKQIGKFSKVEISQVFHCDGLLLLVAKEVNNTRLMVWNPYLGHTRYIQPRTKYHLSDVYALGYDNNSNHKILMRSTYKYDYEIFDFKSNSWRILDDIHYSDIKCPKHSVSLKGNTYFSCREEEGLRVCFDLTRDFLVCFDFTRERFGPRFPFPFNYNALVTVALSSIREGQLAALYKPFNTWNISMMEIQVTTKVEPNEVLWRKFLKVDITDFHSNIFTGSFFIDQEKKLAVLFDRSISQDTLRYSAHIYVKHGYSRKVDLGANVSYVNTVMCVPSFVQINEGLEVELPPKGQKKRLRLSTSLFYSTLFVSLVIFFSFIFSVLY